MHKKLYTAPIKRVDEDDNGDISIIIPAAKFGKNLKLLGHKSLLKNRKDKTLIEKQIEVIKNVYPAAEIIIIIGEDGYKIRKVLKKREFENIRYVYNSRVDESNILYSIGLGIYNILHQRLVIIPGDIYFDENTINNICRGWSKTLIDTNCYLPKDKMGVILQENVIETYSYQSPLKWGKITYLRSHDLSAFENVITGMIDKNQYNLLFHEGLSQIIPSKRIYKFCPSPYFLLEIDSNVDVDRFTKIN